MGAEGTGAARMTRRSDPTGPARERPMPPGPGRRRTRRRPGPGPPTEHRGFVRESGTDRERGSATVLSVGVLAATVLFAGAFAGLGQATAARHRAQGAADAAALAGAARVLGEDGTACEAAAALAASGGAELERCEVEDLEVTVSVAVEPSGIPAAFGPARAVSRAGPVMTR